MNRNKLISGSLVFLGILFLIRIFGCQTYTLQSHEMASTLLPKDRIIVSKMLTGVRFPNTILGLPGADKAFIDKGRIPYFRLPALRKFKTNDIVAFNDPRLIDKPTDRKPIIISRIVALPGDTVIVWDKNLYINRSVVDPPPESRREYRVVTDGSAIPDTFLIKHHVEDPEMIADIGIWDVLLDTIAFQELSTLENVKQIRGQKMYAGDSSNGYWPYSAFFNWNRDQMGPLIVPYKGLSVELDINNVDQYRNIIENHEGNELLIDYRGVFINGREASTYTIQKDYFFVMDDNRDNPNDSRIIGFIPKDHLLGLVKRVLRSPKNHTWLKSLD